MRQELETKGGWREQDGVSSAKALGDGRAECKCCWRNQSLAEASLPAGDGTERHYHRLSEEIYYLTAGRGLMEIDGSTREVVPGDAILIPAGAWHQIRALEPLSFLCCCAPPYAHEDTYFV